MTPEQRKRVRRLQDKLCTKAIRYKGVNEGACRNCERACGYGVELLSTLLMEIPKSWTERGSSSGSAPVRSRSLRRIVRSINKGRGK